MLNRRQAGISPACLRLLFRQATYFIPPGEPGRSNHRRGCDVMNASASHTPGIETEAAMARTRYATDRGLIARMGVTMFLLGLVFTGFIIAIVVLLSQYSNVSQGGIVFIAVLF